MSSDAEKAKQAGDIVDAIRPLLAGRDPDVQGRAVIELLAIWIAGHHESIRPRIMELGLDSVRELVPGIAEVMWQGRTH